MLSPAEKLYLIKGVSIMKKKVTISTPELSVVDNALVWENSVIFLSAISNISTMHFKAMPFPMWAFVVYILGLISLFENALVGFCLLLFSITNIIVWFFQDNKIKNQRSLIILTNDGVAYSFIFKDFKFLDKVYEVLISFMTENKNEIKSIKIDIQNSKIKAMYRS